MSNSNYSIALQRLNPVHTAYCGLHNLAENWSWARDVNSRDPDELFLVIVQPTSKMTILRLWHVPGDVGTSQDRDVETETTTLDQRPQSCVRPAQSWFLVQRDVDCQQTEGVFYRDISGVRGGSFPNSPPLRSRYLFHFSGIFRHMQF